MMLTMSCASPGRDYGQAVVTTVIPLEDEIGDVLEKAMRRLDITDEDLAARSNVALTRILDAIDYRSDLNAEELRRLAAVLGLNEVGVCALGAGSYPQPGIGVLPFCVWPLHMPHGIGVANAYLVGECGTRRALLFDTGAGIDALVSVWPAAVRHLDAVFLTHVEGEHAGGLCDVVARFGVTKAYIPAGAKALCGCPVGEGESFHFGALRVQVFSTPGHSAAHNCYLVRSNLSPSADGLLISGDLVFAGSVGGAFFSQVQLKASVGRMLAVVPPQTVVAPGHGPLTTVENELRFNPFVA